ncbi:MAG: helix-turn-helix transcriptional regulator [Clostridia bacterium]|nr:helix-turn-helix transcriptional regulator [Clostridia bacterium]
MVKLREIRKAKGLTQKELAEIVGVDTSSISKYEKGVAEPSYVVLKKLAGALGVSIDSFSDVEIEMNDTEQEFLEHLRTNRKFRILFDKLKNAKDEDLNTIIAIHNALRETNTSFE